jgi:predicted PurR-regulated permease PerM
LWTVTAVALLLALWLLRSFLVPMAWAFMVALATWPLYRKFAARLLSRLGPTATALLFTILVTLLVLGPYVFALIAIARQAQRWAAEIAFAEAHGLAPPAWLPAVPLASEWLVEQWNAVLGTPGGVSHWLNRPDSAWVMKWVGSAGQFALHHALIITFTILGLFFLYRGGESLAERIKQCIHDKLGPRGDQYFQNATTAVRATMIGMLVVSLIDGVLCGLAYVVAGVPSAPVLAAITGLLAVIPFVAYFVVAGVALILIAKGAAGSAMAVFGWGVLVIFVADKLVRTVLVGRGMRLGFFWVLVGSLGGLETFGFLGLFIGPIILTLVGELVGDFLRETN